MNKKTILKIILLLIIGGVIGMIFSLVLIKLSQSEYISVVDEIKHFFVDNNVAFFIGLILFLYLPAVYEYTKAKRNYSQMINVSDDEIDVIERRADKAFHLSMLINGVFLVLNFMLLGMTFNRNRNDLFLVLFMFMFSIICAAVLEIIAIKYIQKIDNRLKGDPTSFRFSKDFLESCDEAEKLRIYKSGYKAYKISKNVTLGFIVLTIICNMILSTGAFPIFVSCMIMLIQVVSYNYYGFKEK